MLQKRMLLLEAKIGKYHGQGLCNPGRVRVCDLESYCNSICKGYVLPGL